MAHRFVLIWLEDSGVQTIFSKGQEQPYSHVEVQDELLHMHFSTIVQTFFDLLV